MTMKIDGSCHCGYITFAAEIDPETASICHCTDCQTISGSAFRTAVRSRPGTFELRSGTPTLYVKTTAESGTKREHAFCPRCGTAIYATNLGGEAKTHSLRLGTLRAPHGITPKRQIWMRSRVGWLDRLAAVAGVEKQG
jgi:hypothetical protein